MVFFPALPYTPHHIHPKYEMFVVVCFRFVQNAQFFFFPFLLFLIYLKCSSILISYFLFWYIMSTVLTKMLK